MNKKLLKNIFICIGLFVLFFYSWVFQLIPVLMLNLDTLLDDPNITVLLTLFSSVVLGIILYFFYKKELIVEWKKFKESFASSMNIGLTWWFRGVLCMFISNVLLAVIFKSGQSNNEEAVQSMIAVMPFAMLLNSGVVAPWTEEIVFRKSLKGVFKNKWAFVLVSGLLFGLAHVFSSATTLVDWLFLIPYGSLGAAFAAMYYDTDSVFTPIAFHMIHNIIMVVTSIL